jgi:hypothetical protein
MSERYCPHCGRCLEAVKNGFMFAMRNGERGVIIYTSDLWGCLRCKEFHICGCPGEGYQIPLVEGRFAEDPGNSHYLAIISPIITGIPPSFDEHMRKYYPYWHWKQEGDNNG